MIRTVYLLLVNPEALDREQYDKYVTPDERLVREVADRIDHTIEDVLHCAGLISECQMTEIASSAFYSNGTLNWRITHCLRNDVDKIQDLINLAIENGLPPTELPSLSEQFVA